MRKQKKIKGDILKISMEFKDNYFFLSNFYTCKLTYDGLTYFNSEAAFQAQKTLDRNERIKFTAVRPGEAKRLGRRLKLRTDWEDIKVSIMYDICLAKFTQNPELKKALISTGDMYLEEGNDWGDKFWGTVDGKGENNLGKILMKIRGKLKVDG